MSLAAPLAAGAAALGSIAAAELTAIAAGRARGGGSLAALAARVGRLLPIERDSAALELTARAAGLPDAVGGRDLLALEQGAALAGAAISLPSAFLLTTRQALVVMALAAGCGCLAVDRALRARIARRRRALALELPGVLDLLALGVGAGLPMTAALEQVARRHHGLLGTELARACDRMRLGEDRRTALQRLAGRCPHPGVAAAVAAIAQSDRHGVPLAPALDSISAQARIDRARAVREHAARAAPKVQLVIALGLVPATMLLVAAGLVARL